MSDDRPLDQPADQTAKLEQRLADLEAQVVARQARRPTGDMEISFRPTPKDNTLVCNGQAVSRVDYADLFNWATDQGLLGTLFGAGDGSTTFTVPDLRDRFPVGAGGTLSLGATGGVATRALTEAQMPVHNHPASTAVTAHAAHTHTFADSGTATTSTSGDHAHSGSTGTSGDHPGHMNFPITVQSGGGATDVLVGPVNRGAHTHGVNIGNGGSHTHTATLSVSGTTSSGGPTTHTATTTVANAGSGAAWDTRPPFVALSVLIWT